MHFFLSHASPKLSLLKTSYILSLVMQDQSSMRNDSLLNYIKPSYRITTQHIKGPVLGFSRWVGDRERNHSDVTLAMPKRTCPHNAACSNLSQMHKLRTPPLRLQRLISKADNAGPHVALSIISGQGLHYKSSDCGTRWASQGEEVQFARRVETGQSCIAKQRK